MEITVNIVDTLFDSIPKGTVVANYVTEVDTVNFKMYSTVYSIDETNKAIVTTKKIDANNLEAIHFDAINWVTTDKATIDNIYPKVVSKYQNKFKKEGVIYKITKDYDLNNCVLTIPDNCTLQFENTEMNNGTVILHTGCKLINGTFNNLFVLSEGHIIKEWSNVPISGNTISLANNTIAKDSIIELLSDEIIYSTQFTYLLGELCSVIDVDINNNETKLDIDNTYTDNLKVRTISFNKDIEIVNCTFTGPNLEPELDAISFQYCKDCIVRDCTIASYRVGVGLGKSYNCAVINNNIKDIIYPSIGYGVSIGNSSKNNFISSNTFTNCRHGISCAGIYGTQNRNTISNNVFSNSLYPGNAAIDTHGAGRFNIIENNTIDNYNLGVSLRGYANVVRFNTIKYRQTGVYGFEQGPLDITITNNVFECIDTKAQAPYGAKGAIALVRFDNAAGKGIYITVKDNTFKHEYVGVSIDADVEMINIENNIFNQTDYAAIGVTKPKKLVLNNNTIYRATRLGIQIVGDPSKSTLFFYNNNIYNAVSSLVISDLLGIQGGNNNISGNTNITNVNYGNLDPLMKIGVTGRRPTNNSIGDLYFDTQLLNWLTWNGNEWINSDCTLPSKVKMITKHGQIGTPNITYKIVSDIDLQGEELTIPANCTLDFQGGSFSNGTVNLNNSKILPQGCNISDYITATISGTYKEGQQLYNSTAKKMIMWNGTEWVNLDGTALN